MKDIYVCLDYLLNHLYENRFKPEGQRVPFDVDHKVMPDLGLANHEEFKGLMSMLHNEGYAAYLDTYKNDLQYFATRIMITPRGIDFKIKGGYEGKVIRQNAENTRLVNLENNQKFHRVALTVLTAFLAVGTLIAAFYYAIQIWVYYHPVALPVHH